MIDLKPCPFCGNTDVLFRNVEYEPSLWLIECRVCRSEFTVERQWRGRRLMSNRESVIEVWNRRHEDGTT